jgi:ABC-type multidrug transport system fused ATPase/permease subunit
MQPSKKAPTRVLPVLKAYTKATLRYRGTFVAILVGVLGMQFVSITAPLYLKKLVDTLASSTPSAEAVHVLFGIITVYGILGAVNWVSRRLQMGGIEIIEAQVMSDLANEAFDALMRHGHDFFLNNRYAHAACYPLLTLL